MSPTSPLRITPPTAEASNVRMMNGAARPSSRRERPSLAPFVGAVLLVLVAASFGFPVVTLVAAAVLALCLLVGAPLRLVLLKRSAARVATVDEEGGDLETALRPDLAAPERLERSFASTSEGAGGA